MDTFRAALIQMCSSRDLDENITVACELIREAAAQGADYVQTPEVTALMEMKREALFANTPPADDNRAERAFSELAKSLSVWVHIGSMGVRLSDEKIANRAFLFAPTGERVATYDKIHMFDVELDSGERYRESKNYQPGDRAVIADLPFGRLGLTICYDMRFPILYEDLAKSGVDMIAIPSAFTVPTGRAHWQTLLRARAIETQSYVLAAAQAGEHACGRATYGHSMIVSPWGEILAEADESAPQIVMADLTREEISSARKRVPALTHRRRYSVPARSEGAT